MNINSYDDLAQRLSVFEHGLIGIDGYHGAGKSTIARAVARRLSFACVHLDDFLNGKQGGFVDFIQYDDLESALQPRPLVVEGVCLLEVLNRLRIIPDVVVYVQPVDRMPSPSKQTQAAVAFGRDNASSLLSLEVDQYHRTCRPVERADILYLNREIIPKGSLMESGRSAVDIVFIQAKTKLAMTLAAGGMLSLLVGLVVLMYGVTGSDETQIRLGDLESSAKGLGGVIMTTSVFWAYFAYKTRPIYSQSHESSEKYDPESRLIERREARSSTETAVDLGGHRGGD